MIDRLLVSFSLLTLLVLVLLVIATSQQKQEQKRNPVAHVAAEPQPQFQIQAPAAPVFDICTDISGFLNNQVQPLIVALNALLAAAGPLDVSPEGKIGRIKASSSLKIVSFTFDPAQTTLCVTGAANVAATVVMQLDNVQLYLISPIPEQLGTVTITAKPVATFQRSPITGVTQMTSLTISEPIALSALSRPDLEAILTYFVVLPLVTAKVNQELQRLIPAINQRLLASSVQSPLLMTAAATAQNQNPLSGPNTDIKTQIAELLTRQLNALGPYVDQIPFRVCDCGPEECPCDKLTPEQKASLERLGFKCQCPTNRPIVCPCPESTLRNIQFGNVATVQDSGCLGVRTLVPLTNPPQLVCAGCEWSYKAGVNSIMGLENMQITSLTLGNLLLDPLDCTTVRYYFDVQVEVPNVAINYTARGQGCGIPAGSENATVRLGSGGETGPAPSGTITGSYLQGKYDKATGIATFAPNQIKIGQVSLQVTVPSSLTRVNTGNPTIDALILSKINNVTSPVVKSVFQGQVNSKVLPAVNDLVQNVLQGLVANSPATPAIPVFGVRPELAPWDPTAYNNAMHQCFLDFTNCYRTGGTTKNCRAARQTCETAAQALRPTGSCL